MAFSGVVKSFNPHKGWGFLEANGQDHFIFKKELKGICIEKGMSVSFNATPNEKGSQASDVTVLVPPEQAQYFGEVKSFNPNKGFGFITSEAFPGQDVFVLKTEIPGQYAATGNQCKFTVVHEVKGIMAKGVQLLGEAGNQANMMKGMMSGMKGSWGDSWGGGKGGSWGGAGKGAAKGSWGGDGGAGKGAAKGSWGGDGGFGKGAAKGSWGGDGGAGKGMKGSWGGDGGGKAKGKGGWGGDAAAGVWNMMDMMSKMKGKGKGW